jgi:hypothetical protein
MTHGIFMLVLKYLILKYSWQIVLLLKKSGSPDLKKLQKPHFESNIHSFIPSKFLLPPLQGTKTIIRDNLASKVLCLLVDKKNHYSVEVYSLSNIYQ